MSRRGRTHSGTCAIAVASLVCGLHAASLPLDAQPLPSSADQPQADPGIEFQERFSPGIRAQPVFTRPDVQALIASLPPSAGAPGSSSGPPAALAAGAEAEPQPAQSTASVEPRKPGPESPAAAPEPQAEPDIPPPPYPPDIAVSSINPPGESAKATPRPAPRHVSGNRPKNLAAKHGARLGGAKRQVRHVVAASPIRTGAITASHAAAPAAPAACPAGAPCVSQDQTFGIFFGFLAGALLGGPIGALVGGAMGSAVTAAPTQGTGSGHAAGP
ncbi:hypothetical protein [Microvirga sp. TS319]|uniref:hypothetical protein n=1 Tax=Microvirga sp. TS319 TaxID=3241165 RepID=UPI00351A4626